MAGGARLNLDDEHFSRESMNLCWELCPQAPSGAWKAALRLQKHLTVLDGRPQQVSHSQ